MRLPLKQRSVTTWVVIPSAIVIVTLAVLQYRWSARVSEATAVRLADSLQMSLMNWQKDFFRYFSEIALALRIDPVDDRSGDLNQYVRRIAEWKALARYPELISNVYILKSGTRDALRLNSSTGRFEAEVWPERFEPLRANMQTAGVAFLKRPPVVDIGDPSGSWKFEPSLPAMLHAIPRNGSTPDWIVIELNDPEIRTHVLHDLSQTYFQGTDGLDYLIAVVSKSTPGHVIYTSDKGFGDPEPADADGVIDVFGRPYDNALGSPVHVFHMPSNEKGPAAGVRISWFPLLRNEASSLDWRLVVRHRRGGALGAFVTELRRRDLAIGFGVLLVLAINMGMLIVTSHRAQRLAQLQMNFVTAVSHELRTPLTVIISGADNIRNGVVGTQQQMTQYGSLIAKQARQLFGLVERILLFASTRQGRQTYNLKPVQVKDVIDVALASTAGLIEAGEFKVECDIEPNLPPVNADAALLSQCLQNLITNALKYGKDQRWLGIRASLSSGSYQEIQISVSDRGIGISATDLPHIFEPFYRSPSVMAAQISGTGLGLPLSQSIAEGMKGRLTVESTLGRGSTFTLTLSCAEAAAPATTADQQVTA